MKTRVSSKGQLVLPAEFRRQDDIRTGEEFRVERLKPGEYLLIREAPPPNQGLVDLLLACPEKDWYQPLSSGSTAEIQWNILSTPTSSAKRRKAGRTKQ
jgi:AbrB family looped-hinge helix DNA binding protein